MSQYAVFSLLCAAAWSDWKYRKVANRLLFPAMLLGLFYQWTIGQGWQAITGLVCGFAITFVPVLLRGMGMGDQKLLMAVGAWTSFTEVYQLFLFSVAASVVVVCCSPARIALLLQNLRLLLVGWKGHRELWFPSLSKSALTIPYAVYVLAGFVAMQVGEQLWR